MARMPNYIYAGGSDPGPWAKAMSSLGQALFGDPAEVRARETAATEDRYRQLQMDKMSFDLDEAKKKAERDAAFAADISGYFDPATAPAGTQPGFDATIFDPPDMQTAAAPPMLQAPAPTPLAMKIAMRESGNVPTKRLPQEQIDQGLTASGTYGMIDSTFQAGGGKGSAYQATPAEQYRVFGNVTDQNYDAMKQALGREPTDADLYAAWHFGSGKGAQVVRASPDTPMSAILSPAEIEANPYLANQTVGEWRAKTEQEFQGSTWRGELPSVQTASAPGASDQTSILPVAGEQAQPYGDTFEPQPEQPAAGQSRLKKVLDTFTPEELDRVRYAPPGTEQDVFQDILKTKAAAAQKAAEEKAAQGDGLFSGTSMDAQAWNVFERVSKIPPEQRTVEQEFQLGIATSHLQSSPHWVENVDEEGKTTYVPIPKTLPGYPQQTQQTTTPPVEAPLPGTPPVEGQPVPTAPTQPGVTQPVQPAPTTAPTTQPGAYGKPNKVPAEQGGRLSALVASDPDFRIMNDLIFSQDGKINRDVVLGATRVGPLEGFTPEGREFRSAWTRSLEGIRRTLTGAGISKEEVPQFETMYYPSVLDSDRNIIAKLQRMEETKAIMSHTFMTGQLSPEKAAQIRAEIEAKYPLPDPVKRQSGAKLTPEQEQRRMELLQVDPSTITDDAELQHMINELKALNGQ